MHQIEALISIARQSCWMWWLLPATPTLEKLWADAEGLHSFEAAHHSGLQTSMGCMVRRCVQNQTNKTKPTSQTHSKKFSAKVLGRDIAFF